MKLNLTNSIIGFSFILLTACQNRDINEGEEFKPREIHENIQFHFDKIQVDGVEYLILEKDNNNPHEGFGFMAFRANILLEKQDTVIAYLQTIKELQERTYAAVSRKSLAAVKAESDSIFVDYLIKEEVELRNLEQNELQSSKTDLPEISEN